MWAMIRTRRKTMVLLRKYIDYNITNNKIETVEETKAKIASLKYIQDELLK